jgi:hypothetical protein
MIDPTIQTGRVYKHYKGNLYLVLFVGKLVDTEREGEPVVIYQGLLSDDGVYVRTVRGFKQLMEAPDDRRYAVPRFELWHD